jgi:hypothetical protein
LAHHGSTEDDPTFDKTDYEEEAEPRKENG